ncbi:Uncharacterized protein dnl_31400 [Desulfonema limicola]|uniref:Uncharacterized protein n=1 Tax=Desulfonema limicola TaxID=45656 RepID=A0A975B8N1_9BACT|nr:hypothetical protein [Desulfonema limicola]QTA80827.1 Uncharacterized protein dnl_31400 [Desulfonema limicola]
MKNKNPEIEGLVIVIRGNFNPIIFSPVWFASEKLIRKEEAEKAETQIVHPDVVSFNLDWLRLQVTRDMFLAETTKEPYEEVLRDLVLGTFKLLRHTPLKLMGINRAMHFRIDSMEKWHEIGHILAPKNIWNEILDKPGLKSLSIQESERRDGLKGFIRVQVEPSSRVHPGIFISINDHYETKDAEKTPGADEIINIIENNWEKSSKRSREITKKLLEKLNDSITAKQL